MVFHRLLGMGWAQMLDEAVYEGDERRWGGRYLRVAGLEIPYVDKTKAIETISRSFEDRRQVSVAFCNANTMLQAMDSRKYARAMSRFLVLNDGVGVNLCARLLDGRSFTDNLNGTDFTPALLAETPRSLRIFLLGAKPGVADEAAARIAADHPRHTVVGTRHGYFSDAEIPAVLAEINAAKPDLVMVALGNPRQELFVARHGASLDAPVIVMVGALLDFLAGRVVRAPAIVRSLRIEWLFRLAQEPRRLARRYTVDVARFLGTLLWLKLRRATAGLDPVQGRRLRPEN